MPCVSIVIVWLGFKLKGGRSSPGSQGEDSEQQKGVGHQKGRKAQQGQIPRVQAGNEQHRIKSRPTGSESLLMYLLMGLSGAFLGYL